MNDHYIVCGFGSTGRSAIRALLAQGATTGDIVVIEPHPGTAEEATEAGFVTIHGDAAHTDILTAAAITEAQAVIVTPNRDDAAVLVTLTARELNSTATIVVGVREDENLHLLRQSGANSVIHSADAVGRLLGLATNSQPVAHVLDDLLMPGSGLDVIECAAVQLPDGSWGAPGSGSPLAVLRGGDKYHVAAAAPIAAGDRLVVIRPHAD